MYRDTFVVRTNEYGGLLIDPTSLPDTPSQLGETLAEAFTEWQEAGFKLVWLEIPIEKSVLIPAAVASGMSYHHAGSNYLMLTRRLQVDTYIPPAATHAVGAGGAVFNDKEELLVVVEQVHALTRPQYYKLPGGLLEEGEHIAEGVKREVFEETGIQTEFEALSCFRHSHHWRFGKSALYFICRLRPLTREIVIEEEEIAEAKWMPLFEFYANEHVSAFNKYIVRTARQSRGWNPMPVVGNRPVDSEIEGFAPDAA